jgi:hypothetical protein
MRKNLLFTSAGNKSNFFKYWCDDNRNYDIFLCYYADSKDKPYKKYVDFYSERKGGKFQNFDFFWKNINNHKFIEANDTTNPINLYSYEKYFILDDDIIISTNDINELFEIMDVYNLDMLQPSFDPIKSKISHKITTHIPNAILHYTNFIEVNTPMFRHDILKKCMDIYDNRLTGWGIDLLFMWHLGEKKDKYAIIDKIKCINPYEDKNVVREIVKLQPNHIRVSKWIEVKKKFNIPELVLKTFNIIPL